MRVYRTIVRLRRLRRDACKEPSGPSPSALRVRAAAAAAPTRRTRRSALVKVRAASRHGELELKGVALRPQAHRRRQLHRPVYGAQRILQHVQAAIQLVVEENVALVYERVV